MRRISISISDNDKFFIGFIRIHILYHASKEPVYGLWLIEELGRHGYVLSPGTLLYPILKTMSGNGYLKTSSRVINGKIRKYYCITPAGRKVLREAGEKAAELVAEVFPGK
ncbi:transcriptional regulator PadR-like family protein [bacterium BMS3Bbin05]|nr:transcriptional regulator PadR-like family protein [bacterium BMS3Bbin05]